MSTAHLVTSQAPSEIEPLLLDFLAYLELERGLSRNTLEAYRSDLCSSASFLARRGVRPSEATHGDLAAFLAELVAARDARRRRLRRWGARSPACARSTATCAARV